MWVRQASPAVYLAQRRLGSLQAALITKLFLNLLFAQAQDGSLQTPQEPSPPATRASDFNHPPAYPCSWKGRLDRQLEAPRAFAPSRMSRTSTTGTVDRIFPPCFVLGMSTADTKHYEPAGGLLTDLCVNFCSQLLHRKCVSAVGVSW